MKNDLSTLRAENEMSQGDLAEAVGVTRQTINSIERERYNPSLELAFKLSSYFDCRIEKIFHYQEDAQ